MRKLSVVMVALAFAYNANAQQFDGTWTGQGDRFSLTLVVAGTKARLEFNCANGNYGGRSDFTRGPDGVINTPLKLWSGQMQITGTVQSIQVPNGTCGGGTVKMTKKS